MLTLYGLSLALAGPIALDLVWAWAIDRSGATFPAICRREWRTARHAGRLALAPVRVAVARRSGRKPTTTRHPLGD